MSRSTTEEDDDDAAKAPKSVRQAEHEAAVDVAPQGARTDGARPAARARRRPAAVGPGRGACRAQEGEAHLLELGRQSDPPEDLASTRSAMFNKSQNFIEVEVDANMAVMESRKKLVVSYRGRRRARRHHDGAVLGAGLLRQRHPRIRSSDYFNKWDDEVGLLPERRSSRCAPSRASRCSSCRRPAFPISCSTAPTGSRRPASRRPTPTTSSSPPPRRSPRRRIATAIAMRGQTYSAIQVILPIWASAGVKFVDEKGNVDFDSPAAIDVTEKWVGMLHQGQVGAADRRERRLPRAIRADGEEQVRLLVLRPACEPGADDGARRRDPGRCPIRASGPKRYMLANPEGPMMTRRRARRRRRPGSSSSSSATGDAALLYTANRAVPPVRKSLVAESDLPEQPLHQARPGQLRPLVDAALRAQELDQLPGQDRAVLAGGAAREDHGDAVPPAGREVPARAGIAFRISGSDPKIMAGHAVDLRSALCGEEFDRRVVELRRQGQLLPADLVRRVLVGLVIQRQLARPRLG